MDIADQVEFNVIRAAAEQIEQSLTPQKAITSILSIISRQMGLNRGRVLLQEGHTGYLYTAYSFGLTEDERERGRFAIKEGICGKVMASGSPYIVPDIDQEDHYLFRTVSRETLPDEPVSFIATPVVRSGVTVGVLAVNRLSNRKRTLDRDLMILKLIALFVSEILAVNQLLERQTHQLKEENELLKTIAMGQGSQYGIIGESAALVAALNKVSRAANTSVTVMLRGESGTGKEKFARMLHLSSNRRDAPFIAINCAAIPFDLLESELLGHEKGAFTGANQQKLGKVELAHQGTLFLDEIADLDLGLQAKLLRVLEDKTIVRVGGTKPIEVDVRIIVASHKDLFAAVNEKRFRLDLFYRLNVFPIDLPPLRERLGDVRLLIRYFLNQSNQEYNTSVIFDQSAILYLETYNWPGNIRQLENVVKRLVLMADNHTIISSELVKQVLADEKGIQSIQLDQALQSSSKRLTHISDERQKPYPTDELNENRVMSRATNEAVELKPTRAYWKVSQQDVDEMKFALQKTRGNQRQAALMLNMTLRQFNYRLKKLGMFDS